MESVNETKQQQEQQEQADKFANCFYVPVSFVLFLIALTFPQEPSLDTIAITNLWLQTLFDILPFKNVKFQEHLTTLQFHSEQQPLRTRSAFVKFVFAMHKLVLDETLDETNTLLLFENMRANECGRNENGTTKTTKATKEPSCVRTTQQTAFTCVIMTSKISHESAFVVDETLFPTSELSMDNQILWECSMNNKNAFCSCIFAAKWFLLHLVASGYPTNPNASDKYKLHTFLTLFGKLLACFACRVNFQSNMELVQYSPQKDLVSHSSICSFMHRLHETINAMLAKPTGIVTLEETNLFFHRLATQTTDGFFCNVLIAKEKEAFARFYFARN
jgi:hypothetical protein